MTIHLDIVSAEKSFFSGLVQHVSVTGEMGELGVQPGHAPLITGLRPGQVHALLQSGEEEVFYISGGLLEVQPTVVTILADIVERADTLDEAAAIKAKERAEAALKDQQADFDYSKAATELAEAAAQIQAIQKLRKQTKS